MNDHDKETLNALTHEIWEVAQLAQANGLWMV